MKLPCVAVPALTALLLDACSAGATPTPSSVTAGLMVRVATRGLSIGSFDRSRGGIESLALVRVADLRSGIRKMYRARFSFARRLTPAFLHGVDVMLIGVGFSANSQIKPLTSREQTVLVNFVLHGGEALLFADNGVHFKDASNSIVGPFGITSGGILFGRQTANWVDPTRNPLAHGPAGRPAELTTKDPGLLSHYTPAIDLADFAGSTPSAAAYFPAGDLGAASGAAVFFSDSTLLLDGIRTRDDTKAILNALALTR